MSVLKKICELKLKEIQFLKEKKKLKLTSKKTRGFLKKLIKPKKDYFNVIAEIKRSSPSKGVICKNFNLEKKLQRKAPVKLKLQKTFQRINATYSSLF